MLMIDVCPLLPSHYKRTGVTIILHYRYFLNTLFVDANCHVEVRNFLYILFNPKLPLLIYVALFDVACEIFQLLYDKMCQKSKIFIDILSIQSMSIIER